MVEGGEAVVRLVVVTRVNYASDSVDIHGGKIRDEGGASTGGADFVNKFLDQVPSPIRDCLCIPSFLPKYFFTQY